MEFAVIFDLDGVLVDSTSAIPVIAQEVASEYGLKLTPAEKSETTHYPFQVWVGNWNKNHNLSIPVEDVIEKYLFFEKIYLKDHSILYSGILPLLKELHTKKVPMGVATSAPRKRLDNILSVSSITQFFDVTISIDDVKNGKPNPEPYVKTAQKLGVSPNLCVGIEDTNTGLSSVTRAGMKAIGFSPNGKNLAELAEADLIVENFSELSYAKLRSLFELNNE